MNNSYQTTMYAIILVQMYVFLVFSTIFAFYHEKKSKQKLQKVVFYKKYVHLGEQALYIESDNCSSCYCKCFSLKFTQRIKVTQTESNQELTKMTDKYAAEYLKTV